MDSGVKKVEEMRGERKWGGNEMINEQDLSDLFRYIRASIDLAEDLAEENNRYCSYYKLVIQYLTADLEKVKL